MPRPQKERVSVKSERNYFNVMNVYHSDKNGERRRMKVARFPSDLWPHTRSCLRAVDSNHANRPLMKTTKERNEGVFHAFLYICKQKKPA